MACASTTADGRSGLDRLLNPRSIGIVGASPSSGRGGNVQRNVAKFGFAGRLYPVNPKYDQVQGAPCYRALADLPETIDCAIIALPAEPALRVVEECARLGVGGAILFAAGFAEMGRDGVARQQRLAALARQAGLAVCGPNCFGVINALSGTYAISGSLDGPLRPGRVALVSQSGGLSLELAAALSERGVGLSHVISSGNEAATTLEEYLDHLVDDPRVGVLAAVVEGFRNAPLFLDVARRAAARQKPVVVFKLGRSALGSRVASSHTASLAGDDQVLRAVCDRWGITRVCSVDEALETLVLFNSGQWPRTRGVAFVSGSGGRSALLADLCTDLDVPLASFGDRTTAELQDALPPFATVDNPLDLTGAMYDQDGLYERALRAIAADPGVGLLAVYQNSREQRPDGLSPERAARPAKFADLTAAVARTTGAAVASFTTTATGTIHPGIAAGLEQAGIPLLLGPENGLRAIRHALDYGSFLARPQPAVELPAEPVPAAAGPLLDRLLRDGALSEPLTKALLAEYGVAVPRGDVARRAEEAETLAEQLGYPVALKVAAPGLLHKSDDGLVRLNLAGADEVRTACLELVARAEAALPDLPVEGILVEQMIPPGLELIVGARATPFGPVVLFGAGGVLADLVRDTSLRLAPISEDEAERMIFETRVSSLLHGYRGGPRLDQAALQATLVAVGRLAHACGANLGELDVNPLIVSAERAVAVDAKLRSASFTRPGQRRTLTADAGASRIRMARRA
jgi:acetyltransferase